MTALITVAVMPWRAFAYAGWLTFVLPQLAWEQNR